MYKSLLLLALLSLLWTRLSHKWPAHFKRMGPLALKTKQIEKDKGGGGSQSINSSTKNKERIEEELDNSN